MPPPPARTARRGRLPADQRRRREREVLEAATAVVVERGYAGATMQAIAERAGASKETLYAWFGDRDGLVTALIKANADRSAERLTAALADDPRDVASAATTLRQYAAGLLRLLTGDVSIALNRAAMTSPRLAELLLASGRHRVGPIAERYFARLAEAGLVRGSDPAEAYRTFFGLVVRDSQIRVLLGEPPPGPDEVAGQAQLAVDRFLALYGPAPAQAPAGGEASGTAQAEASLA